MKFSLLFSLPIAVSAFSIQQQRTSTKFPTHLYAESGPPQYEKIDAVVSKVEMVGEGSAMIHMEIESDETVDYKAGNVFALEIEDPNIADGVDGADGDKNTNDTIQNGGWMRGPYTISRATDKSFDVMMKVVGDKSKTFASAQPGTPVKFGGKFKVPIVEGISKENTKRVVLLSTGVGVGPCIGAIEEALKEDNFPPIELYASYRTATEIVSSDYLDTLDIQWKAIVTSETGRISASDENMEIVLSSSDLDSALSLEDTHYHIIGNGQMVSEWKEGLAKAGVPETKVTVEAYFNHKSAVDSDAVERIAKTIAKSCAVPAN
jgi:ferredoxin-NADP reductase